MNTSLQRRGDEPALVAAAVHDHVAQEVDGAALPRAAQHAGDRGFEPLVLIGDRQAHAVQPALLERAQELDPERAGLDLADVQADHLPHPGLVHRVGDDQRLGHHPAVVTDLDLLGVKPEIRVGALQRPLPEQLDLLIQRAAQRRDAVLGHPVDPQLLHQPVDLASRDAVDVRLQHNRNDRLLRAPPRLQKAREVRATRPLLRDQQLELPDPRLPRPRPIPIAMRQPGSGATSPSSAPTSARDLRLHQLARDQRDRLTHEILKPTIAHLRNDIGNRHALTFGHRGVSNRLTAVNSRRVRRHGGRPSQRSAYPALVTPLLPKRPPLPWPGSCRKPLPPVSNSVPWRQRRVWSYVRLPPAMAAPSVELSGVSIVAAGAFNPAIFQPQWFLDKALIAENAATSARDHLLVAPELTAFTADWLGVQITLQQASLTTADEGRDVDLRDVAKSVFTLLPETPVDGIGINADAHFRVSSEEAWHEIGDKFLPKDMWEPVFTNGEDFIRRPSGKTVGLRSVMVEVHRPKSRGFIRVEVAPSVRIGPNGVYMGINSHFQLSQQERRGNGYDAVSILDEQWEPTRRLEHHIVERLLDLV